MKPYKKTSEVCKQAHSRPANDPKYLTTPAGTQCQYMTKDNQVNR